jgi:uncharacterized RDD family membrane protein YckC
MKLHRRFSSLAALLTALTLWSPSRAAESPTNPDAIAAKAQAEADKAQGKIQSDLDKAQTEIDRAEARAAGVDDRVEKALHQAFGHHGGHREPTVQVGQSIHVKAGETVQELVVVMGDAVVDGTVEGNLVVVLGKARVNGKVEGNVVNVGKGLILGPDSVVDGDAVGVLGGVEQAAGAKVGGQVVPVKWGDLSDFKLPHWVELTFTECLLKGRPLSLSVGWVWLAAVTFLLGYLLLAAVFPKPLESSTEALAERGATSFLMGLAALPLTAFLSLLLLITGVGVVVLPFLWAALFVAASFGKAAVLRHLGGSLGRQFKAELGTPAMMLVGALVVSLFYLIPYVGIIAWKVLTIWGLGAALLTLFAGFRKERAPIAAAMAPSGFQPAFAAAPMAAAASASVVPPAEPAAPVTPIAMPTPSESGGLGFAAPPVAPVASAFTESAPPSPPPVSYGPPEALTLARVGFGRRFWAALLDWMLLFFVVQGPVLNLSDRWNKVKCLLYLAYFIGFYVWRGTTLGGLVLGLKVVRLDGRKIDFACALVRGLGAVLSGLAGMLGWFWCAWDKDRQTWHDKLAGTVVVRVDKIQPLV